MKSILLIIISVMFAVDCFSQTIFKGLNYNMSVSEAKKEFKTNKEQYDNVDFGNGFVWRIFPQNFIYKNGNLVGVLFQPKGALLGLSHTGTTSYLEFSRSFFEIKGYKVFFEPEYWQYPLNFNSKYGLLMQNEDKTIIVQLYPFKWFYSGTTYYSAYMKVLNYAWFMNEYEKQNQILKDKSENSGF